jgi:hypothetical protein
MIPIALDTPANFSRRAREMLNQACPTQADVPFSIPP